MNYRLLSFLTFLIAVTPFIVFAQEAAPPRPFRVLVGIPGIDAETANFGDYINALYILSISIAALLAVIKIIIAGVKYMLSDLVSSKAEAKSDITGALFGLLIVIGAVVILETINPQLRQMNVFANMQNATTVIDRPVRDSTAAPATDPLPGRIPSATDQVTPCATYEACLAARDSCLSNPIGNVPQSVDSSTRQVRCEYGETVPRPCRALANGAFDCSRATTACTAPSQGTRISEGGRDYISCYTENTPRPGGARGTAGGA